MTSLVTREAYAYLGSESGWVYKFDMNTKKLMAEYDTRTNFPVVGLKITNGCVIATTCNGQIHVLSFTFEKSRSIQAH